VRQDWLSKSGAAAVDQRGVKLDGQIVANADATVEISAPQYLRGQTEIPSIGQNVKRQTSSALTFDA
jgi:hypothetical protein